MKRRNFLLLTSLGLASRNLKAAINQRRISKQNGIINLVEADLRLWYNQPAANWNEALPIGNGRLAAMVFGGTQSERIQLNEDTVWAGEKRDRKDVYRSVSKKFHAAVRRGGMKLCWYLSS